MVYYFRQLSLDCIKKTLFLKIGIDGTNNMRKSDKV